MIRILLLSAALLAAAPAVAETSAQKPVVTPPTVATPVPDTMKDDARVDLNTATVEQLMSVKGINKSIAEAIVKARPFRSVEELTARKIVSAAALRPVKDQLVIR